MSLAAIPVSVPCRDNSQSAQWESNPHIRHGKATGSRYIMGANTIQSIRRRLHPRRHRGRVACCCYTTDAVSGGGGNRTHVYPLKRRSPRQRRVTLPHPIERVRGGIEPRRHSPSVLETEHAPRRETLPVAGASEGVEPPPPPVCQTGILPLNSPATLNAARPKLAGGVEPRSIGVADRPGTAPASLPPTLSAPDGI